MHNRTSLWLLRTLATLLLFCVPANLLQAQEYIPTPEELEQLLAPVALYPDALLAQITSASTNPQEILDVSDWLHQNSRLNGLALTHAAQAQGFDPAFIALVNFPQVLDMMAQNIDDYAAIGAAFEADQGSVMDAVQNLRQDAYEAGALRNGPQQRVILQSYNGQQIILIEPANPQFVYIPRYDPAAVYGYGGPGAVGWITFGAGISLAVALGSSHPWGWSKWGWNWQQRRLLYNRLLWRTNFNRYRPPRSIYRPHRPNFGNRPVIRPPRPGKPGRPPTRPTPGRPGRPSIQPVRPAPGRPSVQPVRPAPGKPSTRPVRPATGKPAQPVRPAPGKPSTHPVRPTRPANGGRPAPAPNKPAPNRPAQPARPARPANGERPAARPQQPQKRPPPKPRPEAQPQ